MKKILTIISLGLSYTLLASHVAPGGAIRNIDKADIDDNQGIKVQFVSDQCRLLEKCDHTDEDGPVCTSQFMCDF